jgi:hypothetical protein
LVLDQFEEFLLYHPKPTETRFVQDLATLAADPDSEAHVLLSLREDSLASLDALRAVIPGILSSPVQLRLLDRKAAEQAIRKPVAKWSEDRFGDPKAAKVEDPLVETLLDQVRHSNSGGSSSDVSSNAPAEFVDLPWLQLTLERLWDEEAKVGMPALRLQTLERLGGAEEITRQHLDQTLEDLPALHRTLAIRLFAHLVTATGAKHAWRADDLATEIDADRSATRKAAEHLFLGRVAGRIAAIGAAVKSLFGGAGEPIGFDATKTAVADTLDRLATGKARILRTQPDPQRAGPLFELYHDALARPVLSWVDKARIKDAEGRLKRLAALAASVALLMMAGIVVVAIFWHRAVVQQREAQMAEARAVSSREEAQLQKDRAVAAQAQTRLQQARAVSSLSVQATDNGDAMTGMLAALAVLPGDLSKPDRPLSNAAAAALLYAWLHNREQYDMIGHTQSVSKVAVTPDRAMW